MAQNPDGNILVFDVGGSHISASVFGSSGLAVRPSPSVPVSASASLTEFLEAISSVGERVLPTRIPPVGVSIAIPNPFDYAQGVSYMRHKYQSLFGIDLRTEISRLFNCAPGQINFLNDAAAFLTGEIAQGHGRGVRRVVGITLGTGAGSAFAVDGELRTEGPGVPPGGEIWNLPYRGSTVEEFVSAAAIQRFHQQNTGQWCDVLGIARAGAANADARLAFEQFGKELGLVLRATCGAFAPERIVLGGGISRAGALFLPSAAHELAGLPIHLAVSQLGENAALIGAAVNWMQNQNGSRVPREQDHRQVGS